MLRGASRLMVRQARQSGLVQQQRCFAEAAVAPKFDWESLENTVASDDGKRDLASLRSTFIDVQQKFDSMSQSTGEIDWKSYEKEVDPQVLKAFRDSFSSMDFPAYDASSLANEAEQKLSEIIKQADELKAYSAKRMTELDKEIKDVEAAMEHVAHATIDEELARDPATAKQIDKEISEGNFIP